MRRLVATGGTLAALACAPAALAGGNPSEDAYAGPAQQVKSVLTAAPLRVTQGGGNQLPMTGMDLSVIAAAGVGLAGMGFALRRLGGRQEQD